MESSRLTDELSEVFVALKTTYEPGIELIKNVTTTAICEPVV
jgi:hypothetical protein